MVENTWSVSCFFSSSWHAWAHDIWLNCLLGKKYILELVQLSMKYEPCSFMVDMKLLKIWAPSSFSYNMDKICKCPVLFYIHTNFTLIDSMKWKKNYYPITMQSNWLILLQLLHLLDALFINNLSFSHVIMYWTDFLLSLFRYYPEMGKWSYCSGFGICFYKWYIDSQY